MNEKLEDNEENKLFPFENAFYYNKNFKCIFFYKNFLIGKFGKSISFTTKIVFHAISLKSNMISKNILEFQPQDLIFHFEDLKVKI